MTKNHNKFDQAVNGHLDKQPTQHWWVNFVSLLIVAGIFALAAYLIVGLVGVKALNIVGALGVAVGLAAQAADTLTALQREQAGVTKRHRAPQLNVFGLALASGGASFVVIGQVMGL